MRLSQSTFLLINTPFRLSRCLLAAADLGCLEDMLKLVSIMSVDTIFLTSSNLNEKMKMQRQKFTMNEGDHLTLLNVYKTFIANKKTKVKHLFPRLAFDRLRAGMVSSEQDQSKESPSSLCNTETTPTDLYRTAIGDEIMWNEIHARSVRERDLALRH